MERVTPSARNVAAKILGRSGLVTSTRNIKEHVSTPSEDVTPRTLIGGILDAASVSKSGLVVPQTRKSKLTKSPAAGPPAKRNKALRQSLGDNVTPRTIIQNFLLEASPETPLQVPLKHPENNFQGDSTGIDASTPSIPDDVQAPASSLQSDSEATDSLNLNLANPKAHSDHMKDSIPNAEGHLQSSLAIEAEKEEDALLGEDSENDDYEDAKVPSPAPLNTEVAEQSPEQATASSTTLAYDEQGSNSDSIPHAEATILSIDHTSEAPGKRMWKDLVTPHLPVKRRNVLSENQLVEEDNEEERKTRTSEAAKKQPPLNKRTKTKSTSCGDKNLPSSLVKSVFQHFSKSRISRNTLSSIEKGSSVFFKQISSDLMAYSRHAGRSTIEIGDVELLMKRQGFITDKQSLNSLIEKYLPLEYRQELIPVVQSGNNVVLKKSN